MRQYPIVKAERHRLRIQGHFSSETGLGNCGLFKIPLAREELRVIVSDCGGWDHVSVSLSNRCPTWEEMCLVKELFFRDDEWAMQLHPARKEHISYHPYTLHIWRPQSQAEREALHRERGDAVPEWPTPGPIPIPPSDAVAPASVLPNAATPAGDPGT